MNVQRNESNSFEVVDLTGNISVGDEEYREGCSRPDQNSSAYNGTEKDN